MISKPAGSFQLNRRSKGALRTKILSGYTAGEKPLKYLHKAKAVLWASLLLDTRNPEREKDQTNLPNHKKNFNWSLE